MSPNSYYKVKKLKYTKYAYIYKIRFFHNWKYDGGLRIALDLNVKVIRKSNQFFYSVYPVFISVIRTKNFPDQDENQSNYGVSR